MGKNRPIKFRILELFLDGEEHWNYEIVSKIQEEYNMQGNYGRDSINLILSNLLQAECSGTWNRELMKKGSIKKGSCCIST